MSGTSCQQVAADGYALSGINIYYRLGVDFTWLYHHTAGSEKPHGTKYQLKLGVLTTLNKGGYADTVAPAV